MNKKTFTKSSLSRDALALHKKLGGKIRVESAISLRDKKTLGLVYTPGVGAVSSYLATHKREVPHYTMKGRTIAIVSDGSAVLGLGNIGPEAALPVMEGKAMLFKALGRVDAVPLVLATQDVDEIVRTVVALAPTFGGINLEDIAAPRCFEIERRLKEILDIPVMHDDQHGTAIVVLAGVINAFQVVKKHFKKSRAVIVGAGAAGTAIAMLLVRAGMRDVIVIDREGIITKNRDDLSSVKKDLAKITNPCGISGDITRAMEGADIIIGVSGPGTINASDIATMATQPIVFALANPIPEIMPDEAISAGAYVVATGRSDFPNQINNALVFPGIFKGALTYRKKTITEAMKLKAAYALATLVPHPTRTKIIPGIFDKRVATTIAKAMK